jgi:hypothetical protein
MNKEQKELLSDVYKNFQKTYQFEKDANHILPDKWMTMSNDFMNASILSQEEFTNKIKTDNEFAKQWGVVYEERELSLEERCEYDSKKDNVRNTWKQALITFSSKEVKKWLDEKNVPKRAISITYNNKTIESYEFI